MARRRSRARRRLVAAAPGVVDAVAVRARRLRPRSSRPPDTSCARLGRDAETRRTGRRRLQLQPGLDALDGFHGLRALTEGGEPEIAFAARTETGPGRSDHVRLVEQLVEELPGAEAGGGLRPDVRRVSAPVDGEADGAEPFADDAGVLHVEVDGLPHLLLSVGRVYGGRGLLDDVGDSVELGGLTAEPERVHAHRLAARRAPRELLRDHRERAARPREPR